MAQHTFNTVNDYLFGSPRYHSITNYPTILVPEDYVSLDASQGTYDLHYPLYALNSNPIPQLELIDQTGKITTIQGSLQLKLFNKQYKIDTFGKTDSSERPQNSNLDQQVVKYDHYLSIKLNPGWCHIQETIAPNPNSSKETYIPRFLIRTLGTNTVVKTVHALELSGNNTVSNTAFPRGTVVEYKNVLWKCLLATVKYPPISYKIKVPEWQVLLEDNNPFKADLFVINGDRIEYVIEIVDTKRKFRPNTADSSLLTWNLSYHH